MKNLKQIRESYDFITDKSHRDQRNLDALVEAGLFEERKLPVLKKILESSADKMSGSEKRFITNLLESLIVQFSNDQLSEAKEDYLSKYDPRGKKDQPSDSELPPVIILKRKAIRVYPDHQKVALYYAQSIDRYVSIPYGGNHVMAVNEEMSDDDKRRPASQRRKEIPISKRKDLTMADLPEIKKYLLRSTFASKNPLSAALINLGTYSGIKSRLKKAAAVKKPKIEPKFSDIPKVQAPKKTTAPTSFSPTADAASGVWKQRRLEESFKNRVEVLREQAALKYDFSDNQQRNINTNNITKKSATILQFPQEKNVFKKKPSVRKELKNLQQKIDRTKRVSPVDAKEKPARSDNRREQYKKAAQERIARKNAEVKPDKVKGKSGVPSILKRVGPEIGKLFKFGINRNPLIGAISDATPANAPEVQWLKDKEATKRITAREPGGNQDLAKQIKKRDAAAAATMFKDAGVRRPTTSFLNAPDRPVPQISTTKEPVVSTQVGPLSRQLSAQQSAQVQAQANAQAPAQALAQATAQANAQQSSKTQKQDDKKQRDADKRRSSGPKNRRTGRSRGGRLRMPDISLPSLPPGPKEPGPNYQFGLKPSVSVPTAVTNRAAVDKWTDIINRKANQAMLRENTSRNEDDEDVGSAMTTQDNSGNAKPVYNFRRKPRVSVSKASSADAAVQRWMERIGRQANQAMLRQQDQQESVYHTIQNMIENNITEKEIVIGEQAITINNTVAKKIVSLHESMNKKNKKKMEEMLNESATSFNKVLTFAVRH
jgi:hypothetical protein